ncbi:SAP domain-containing ribonucleoprotein isoform X1 [Bombina bombina]|uniref:SAP domain-containing ribonucleoprotein isoform X1 n=1 Tax=Bombina bombina TaxID=8345 RepID=UPI00235A78C9|nr:SAP domain-containing ribonucleoprotein isoform X1 [Bombina bombina]
MADVVDIHKLKLAELKQECLSHGLDAKGNKQDLINRLQTYLDEHAEEEANEEDVLGEETEEEDQKVVQIPVKEDVPPEENPSETESEKKLVKITSEVSVTDRLQKRAERFNVPTSLDSKKAARAARFGITSADPKGQSSDPKSTVNLDKLKERGQRFGLSVSPLSRKTEDDEKLKKRKERFGIVTNSASVTDDIEAKKRKRSERFGIV